MTITVTIQNEMKPEYKEKHVLVYRREITSQGLSSEYLLTTLKSGDKFTGSVWDGSTLVIKEVKQNESQ